MVHSISLEKLENTNLLFGLFVILIGNKIRLCSRVVEQFCGDNSSKEKGKMLILLVS